jgi:hypothetical protein
MLEIFEILDRFELLYSDNNKLSDLRRAYIDRDLNSIFRIVNDQNKEDLRKLILEDNAWKLWPLLDNYVDTQFVSAFKNFYVNNLKIDNDCFSRGQLQSKLWLVNELKKLDVELGTVFLCAGWYGTLAVMLFESGIKIDKIRSFDIDPTTVDIAEVFNKPWFTDQWRFKSLIQNIQDIDYREHTWQYWSNANNRMSYPITDIPNTIINTSCEHIENFKDWYEKIPSGNLVILQGNNYFEVAEHVNCSTDLDEFDKKAPMTNTLFKGELVLPKYTRFMKIGIK